MGGIFYDDWKMLTEARNVKSVYLTHLIRAYDDEKAYKTLVDILDDKMLKASFSRRNNHRTVKGNKKVVCFQDISLNGIKEIIEGERWCGTQQIYQEFGIQIDKRILFSEGARPVIYDGEEILQFISEDMHWRVVNLDLDINKMKCLDWTHECEWRIPVDVKITRFPFKVIVKTEKYKKRLLKEDVAKRLDLKEKDIIVFEEAIT